MLALSMPATLRQDAIEAATILEAWGRSLAEAAKHYATHLKAEQARAAAVTVEVAVKDYLNAKRQEHERGELADLTLRELRFRVGIVQRAFAGHRSLAKPKCVGGLATPPSTVRSWCRVSLRGRPAVGLACSPTSPPA